MRHPFPSIALASLALALAPLASSAALSVDDDLLFAKELVNFQPSFADYAQKVVDNILRTDPGQKNKTRKEAVISADDSKVTVCVIPTNEEIMIARDTLDLVTTGKVRDN